MLSSRASSLDHRPSSLGFQADFLKRLGLTPSQNSFVSKLRVNADQLRTDRNASQMKAPLSQTHPELAAEWHATKNGDLDIDEVFRIVKVWWKCAEGPDHEWQATLNSRLFAESGCPYCDGKRVSVTNSLAARFPAIAAQWHPTKNDTTAEKVTAGLIKRVWWKCPNGPDHEWQTTILKRTRHGTGCPFCKGQRVSVTNSLAALFPHLAAEWHSTKNGSATPDTVVAGSEKKVWWKCPKGPDHEWEALLSNRTRLGRGCPFCAGVRASVTNSLAALYPDVACELHPTKNGNMSAREVVAGSERKLWWQCPSDPQHHWQATPAHRTKEKQGCPLCSNRKLSTTNNLAALYPEIAAEWDFTKNKGLTPDRVVAGAAKKVWWRCPKGQDHVWQTRVVDRTTGGLGCPFCAGKRVSTTNSLATLFPTIASEWHATKNGNATPTKVVAGSAEKAWWQCPKNRDHVWQTKIVSRTSLGSGCPYCNRGWTLAAIRVFVSSLKQHLRTFVPAELYLLFQQNGLLVSEGKRRAFVKALATGRFPKVELDKFVNGEPSLVDEFIQDPTQTLEALEARDKESGIQENLLDRADELVDDVAEEDHKNCRSSRPKRSWVRSASMSSPPRMRKRSNSCWLPRSPRFGSMPMATKRPPWRRPRL